MEKKLGFMWSITSQSFGPRWTQTEPTERGKEQLAARQLFCLVALSRYDIVLVFVALLVRVTAGCRVVGQAKHSPFLLHHNLKQ
jgi:hypothetical protein